MYRHERVIEGRVRRVRLRFATAAAQFLQRQMLAMGVGLGNIR
jgi:hypothetical protein